MRWSPRHVGAPEDSDVTRCEVFIQEYPYLDKPRRLIPDHFLSSVADAERFVENYEILGSSQFTIKVYVGDSLADTFFIDRDVGETRREMSSDRRDLPFSSTSPKDWLRVSAPPQRQETITRTRGLRVSTRQVPHRSRVDDRQAAYVREFEREVSTHRFSSTRSERGDFKLYIRVVDDRTGELEETYHLALTFSEREAAYNELRNAIHANVFDGSDYRYKLVEVRRGRPYVLATNDGDVNTSFVADDDGFESSLRTIRPGVEDLLTERQTSASPETWGRGGGRVSTLESAIFSYDDYRRDQERGDD